MRCNILLEPETNSDFCDNEVVAIVQVKIRNAYRISYQDWNMCQLHLDQIVKDNGEGWFTIYTNGKKKGERYPVMNIEEVNYL